MSFTFYFPTRLMVGAGTLSQLGPEAKSLGRRALVVTGKQALKQSGFLDKALDSLRAASVDIVHADGVETNPTVPSVDHVGHLARKEKCDVVIGLGGGS